MGAVHTGRLVRARRRGFTIVEVMIALFVGAVVVGAVYAFYSQAAAAYGAEQQFTDALSRVQFGLDTIKADLERTGLHATVSSPQDILRSRVCYVSGGLNLYGITVERNTGDVYLSTTQNINIQPTAVVLFGDFWSPDGHVFTAIDIDDAGVVTLQPAGEDSVLDSLSQDEFNEMFRPGVRWLRVVNQDEHEWYAKITSADFTARTLTLDGVPTTGPCRTGLNFVEINPVGWIRYRIVTDDGSAYPVAPGEPLTGKTDLIREELSLDAGGYSVVAGTRLPVVEYAVDLQLYDFGFDTAPFGGQPTLQLQPNVEDVANTDGTGLLGEPTDAGARPDELRFVTIKLSVRTNAEDRTVRFVQRAGLHSQLLYYDIDPNKLGAARVLSLAQRITLENFWVWKYE